MPDKTSAPPLRGQLIEIGAGRALRAVFAGPADGPWPLVVLEAGAFGFAADWAAVQDQLARVGLRSMAYDRAGLGFSRPGPEPRDGEAIAKRFPFPDFSAALAFAVRVGMLAEKRDHHPDILVAWGKTTLLWTTHDAGGVTELDLELAAGSDALLG